MCGICGEKTFDGSPASAAAIEAMLHALAPRGPNGRGLVNVRDTALGHRRLAVIDLSERSSQPMTDDELGLDIAFNGCVFNYRELRRDLEAHGYRFFSDGDTEVVLKSHHKWGLGAPEKLRGMFAYAISERASGRLFLARDRFGIKPLYFSKTLSRLRFASTLPALVRAGDVDTQIDREALSYFMTLHSIVPPPLTILKGVRKLAPATIKVVEPTGEERDTCYWSLGEGDLTPLSGAPSQWIEHLQELLVDAVRAWRTADFPVGLFLSGGLDSSLLLALMVEAGASPRTYSIGFESTPLEAGNEFVYSDLVSSLFGTTHNKLVVDANSLLCALPHAVYAMSEPMVSHDCAAFYLLSKHASQTEKVVLCGQGADELFAGYHWHPKVEESSNPAATYVSLFSDRSAEKMAHHLNDEWLCPADVMALATSRFASSRGSLQGALRTDVELMMPDDPVKRLDNMTMAWGLEGRVPFLDHQIAEFALRVPAWYQLQNGGKNALKALASARLPHGVVYREKGYFPVPALKYLDGDFLALAHGALLAQPARNRGIFRQTYLDQLFENPNAYITPLRGSELWQCASLELWLQAHEL